MNREKYLIENREKVILLLKTELKNKNVKCTFRKSMIYLKDHFMKSENLFSAINYSVFHSIIDFGNLRKEC